MWVFFHVFAFTFFILDCILRLAGRQLEVIRSFLLYPLFVSHSFSVGSAVKFYLSSGLPC